MESITPEVLEEMKTTNKKIVVDYWAEWCGPCKILTPTLEGLSEEIDDVTFVKINVDENMEHAQTQGIRSIPTIVYINDGVEVQRTSGALPAPKIKEVISTM